ncbi:unnamed protein product [Adineta steineri]|uniref:Ubiquitin-like domain-containing protein n=1 Tax=Adineta steineri TaxID=433720 RepID=A0A814N0G9_9BILA|nr:unnamed protein product [Adineta steineri]CAF4172395.1 unnamed protein product [Adineta steineri]
MENSINNQLQIDKKVRNELKSRSFIFIDPFGNRTTKKYMDHQSINKILRDYKKKYVPKYLQQWVQIGTKNDDIISALNEDELKSTVSEYENGQEFVSYGEISVFIGIHEDRWPRSIVVNMLLMDNIEKLKTRIKQQQQFHDFELRSCFIGSNTKPSITNWDEGMCLKSEETIMSNQLYQNSGVVLAKIIDNKVDSRSSHDFQIFVKTLTGTSFPLYVNSKMDVLTVKELIQDVHGIPCDLQRLIFNRMQLEDDKILSDYDIPDEGTVHFLSRLRGGMYDLTSGRQDFRRLSYNSTNTIQNVLTFKFENMNHTQQLSPSELQNSIVQGKEILSTLYREIQKLSISPDIPDLRNIILPIPNDNEDNIVDDENNDKKYCCIM